MQDHPARLLVQMTVDQACAVDRYRDSIGSDPAHDVGEEHRMDFRDPRVASWFNQVNRAEFRSPPFYTLVAMHRSKTTGATALT